MNNLTRTRKLTVVALAALAIVLTVNAPSEAAGRGGGHGLGGGMAAHGFVGGRPGGAVGHHGFGGHHGFEGRHGFDRDHDFDRGHFDRGVHRGFGGFAFGPVIPFYGYDPYYDFGPYPAAPTYWYYCPTYGAYYPSVPSCPEPWVPVPVS